MIRKKRTYTRISWNIAILPVPLQQHSADWSSWLSSSRVLSLYLPRFLVFVRTSNRTPRSIDPRRAPLLQFSRAYLQPKRKEKRWRKLDVIIGVERRALIIDENNVRLKGGLFKYIVHTNIRSLDRFTYHQINQSIVVIVILPKWYRTIYRLRRIRNSSVSLSHGEIV